MSIDQRLVIEYVPLDSLHPDPANPRRIDEDGLDKLNRSVGEFAQVQPVLARMDGTLIAGHQRLVVARRRGDQTVPVIYLDVTPERGRLLGLALNNEYGIWDDQLLARLIADLDKLPEIDISLAGFDEDRISDLLRSLETAEKRARPETFDLDAALAEATREPRAKRGDLWRLGEHRLLCGDATDPGDVSRLLGGTPAAMAFTDPPYGVNFGHHGGHQRGTRRRTIANDALPPAAWEAFLRPAMTNLLASVDGAIYVCMSSKELPTLSRIMADLGAHWSDTLIWRKDRFVLGRADFQREYEPLWYGWREGAKHHWAGGRDQSDVWEIARPAESILHPAMKPLGLIERAILNSCPNGATVLDPFVGSGSTLIACERTGRLGAAIELDPVYVDIAVRRWERFTGLTAVLSDALETVR